MTSGYDDGLTRTGLNVRLGSVVENRLRTIDVRADDLVVEVKRISIGRVSNGAGEAGDCNGNVTGNALHAPASS